MAGRPRLSAAETRERLLTAALEHLDASGMGANLDQVSLETFVRVADVPRSSAYNAWQSVASEGSTAQVAFQREVMRRAILGDGVGARNDAPMAAATRDVLARRDDFTPRGLRQELLRLGIGAQFSDASQRRGYRLATALSAASTSVPEEEQDPEVLLWLREAEATYLARLVGVFQYMARITSSEPNPELAGPHFWQTFATAVIALGEGLFPRMRTSDVVYLVDLDGPGPDGQTVKWSLFALGVDALWERFFRDSEAAT